LRQEFQELEILDDITKMCYEGKLHPDVSGCGWNTLICQYQAWKGHNYVPKMVHKALKWTKDDPLILKEVEVDRWVIIDKSLKNKSNSTINIEHGILHPAKRQWLSDPNYLTAKGSEALPTLSDDHGVRARKSDIRLRTEPQKTPCGIKWDSMWWSCAYDSIIVILFNIWKDFKRAKSPLYYRNSIFASTL
ncbi:hypothetical protein K439DRAFT_1361561, partial [Ramaria rubella]